MGGLDIGAGLALLSLSVRVTEAKEGRTVRVSNSQEAELENLFLLPLSNTGYNRMKCGKLNGGNVMLLHVLCDLCRYILLEIN